MYCLSNSSYSVMTICTKQAPMDALAVKPPCGADCFSHISTIQSSSVKTDKESDVKTETTDVKDSTSQWSGQEVTLYHLLQPIYGNNHCIIADIIRTKNCKQVC